MDEFDPSRKIESVLASTIAEEIDNQILNDLLFSGVSIPLSLSDQINV